MMCKNGNWSVRTLRRLVLIELKLGEFEPQDKGQVELYLRWLEKYEKAEGEEKQIIYQSKCAADLVVEWRLVWVM